MSETRRQILVTGATGFIGRELVTQLSQRNCGVIGVGRSINGERDSHVKYHCIDLETDNLEHKLLEGVDCVVHLAAKAHGKAESAQQQLSDFRRANLRPSAHLGRLAIETGIKRFVFVSSIGVHGAITEGVPVSESSATAPHTVYALSKLEAERELIALFERQGVTELTIVRPPLVYGDQAPGNFQRLLRLARSGVPLPFLGCSNRRSFVSLNNFVDFLQLCIDHPDAGNELFVVADGSSISTEELIGSLRKGMGLPRRLFSFPRKLMSKALGLINKEDIFRQLYCDFEVDCSKAVNRLGWHPDQDTMQQLENVGRRYVGTAV